jgi:hypothetical protein
VASVRDTVAPDPLAAFSSHPPNAFLFKRL